MLSESKKRTNNFLTRLQESTGIDMHYIARGGGWNFFSFIITTLLSLVTAVLFANLIPKETYGIYKYLISLVSSFGFLTLTGMNTAVIQAVSKGYDEAFQYSVKIQLKWNLLFTLATAIIGSYYLVKGNLIFAFAIFILAVLYPINAALNTYGAFLTGKKEFRRLSVYSIITTAFYTGAMALTLFLTSNILILITVYSLGTAIPRIFYHKKITKLFKPAEMPTKEKKELIKYSGHLTFVNIFSIISNYIDKIAVFQFLGPVQLAVYSFALVMPERIEGIFKNFQFILMPKIAQKEIKDIKKVFYKRIFQGLAIGGLISLIFIFFVPFIFKLFFPKYMESVIYTQILSLGFIILAPANYMTSIFRSHKMMKIIYLGGAFPHIAKIVLYLTLVKAFGIWGIIWATLLVYLVSFFYILMLWEIEMRKRDKLNQLSPP